MINEIIFKTATMKSFILLLTLSFCVAVANADANNDIVRDGEYHFLQSQFADEWVIEDVEIDKELSTIRNANGGKSPNIIYILIDDVSFG